MHRVFSIVWLPHRGHGFPWSMPIALERAESLVAISGPVSSRFNE
jgi:hypothetical protein